MFIAYGRAEYKSALNLHNKLQQLKKAASRGTALSVLTLPRGENGFSVLFAMGPPRVN